MEKITKHSSYDIAEWEGLPYLVEETQADEWEDEEMQELIRAIQPLFSRLREYVYEGQEEV